MRTFKAISISLLVLAFLTFFVGNYILNNVVKTRLAQIINNNPDRKYDFIFDAINFKWFSGELTITDLKIVPHFDNKSDEPVNSRIKATLTEFRLVNLNVFSLIFHNTLKISEISIQEPNIELYRNVSSKTGREEHTFVKSVITPTFLTARVSKLQLSNAKLSVFNVDQTDTVRILTFDSLNYSLTGVLVDSSTISAGSYFKYDRLSIGLKNINVDAVENISISLDSLHYDPESKILSLINLNFIPKQDPQTYMKSVQFETDWMQIKIKKVEIKNLDFDKLLENRSIHLSELKVQTPDIKIYRDKRLPDPIFKFKPLPSQLLAEMESVIDIPSLVIQDGKVHYQEWGENAKDVANIYLDNISINIDNITTLPEKLNINDTLSIKLSGKFMKSGDLALDIKMNVTDKKQRFHTIGSISKLQFASLNPLSEHLLKIKFNEGKLDYINFWFNGNNKLSKGRLDIKYHDLSKIYFESEKELAKSEVDGKTKPRKLNSKFMTLMANTYISNEYGPETKKYFQGRINFHRNENKSIVNFIVKSIITGIESSLLPMVQGDYKEMKRERRNIRKSVK